MAQVSQLGFWMFAGALGAVGIAATAGYLDQAPRGAGSNKTALIGEQVSGSNAAKKQKGEEVAKLSTDEKAATEKKSVVSPAQIIPTFDILRVEKDGATLIAGNAAPDSIIEIFDGVTIVAKTTAGNNGDFVAILENPLTAGEHQLGIRATGKDNKVQVSKETGLVSMPKKKDGPLLAMVMKPGEASRILQKPEGEKPATPEKVAEVEAKSDGKTTASSDIVAENKAPEKKAEEKSEGEVKVASNDAPKDNANVPAKTTEMTANENKSGAVGENIASASNENQEKTASLVPEKSNASGSTNPVQSSAAEKSVEKPAEKAPTIVVEAVEVDGTSMFIAGAAEPGRRVALYVDNKFIGFADGSREGRFLLEVERELARGKHVVRADIYDAAGTEVSARAEVPLIHEPEDKPVVVAKVEEKTEPAEKQAASSMSKNKSEQTENSTEVKKQPVEKSTKPKKVVTAAAKSKVKVDKPVETTDIVAKTGDKPVIKKPVVAAVEEKKSPAKTAKAAEVTVVATKIEKTDRPEKNLATSNEQKSKENIVPAKLVEAKPVDEKQEKVAKSTKTENAASGSDAKKQTEKNTTVEMKKAEPAAPQKMAKTVKAPVKKPDAPSDANSPVAKVAKVAKAKANAADAKAQEEKAVTAKAPEAKSPVEKPMESKVAESAAPKEKAETKVASLVSKVAEATKVLRTGSSVIIRRGDSLWRISYRTYGRGIRYSTIYKANLKQLRSPHRIYPGQILKVPKRKFSGEG